MIKYILKEARLGIYHSVQVKTQIIPLHLFFSSTYNNPHHNNQNHSIPNIYSLFDLLL